MRRFMRSRVVSVVALAAAVAVAASGCSVIAGSTGGDMEAIAVFEDTADMADGAPVFMADVRIGNVSTIELDETKTKAKVTMSFDSAAGVPAEVEARVRRTSPLGEKFVELRPLTDDLDAPLLEDGAVIEQTELVADFEQLVASGTDVFAALGASEIAVLLDEGARGFGGKGQQIRQVLDNFSVIASGFAANTDDIELLIRATDELASTTGPSAQAHGEALANLAETTTILDQESEELLELVDSLSALSEQGGDILRTHFDRISRQIDGLRSVTRAVVTANSGLNDILSFTRGHNRALNLGVPENFAQVLNDFVLCGVPGGGEIDDGGVNDCTPGARG